MVKIFTKHLLLPINAFLICFLLSFNAIAQPILTNNGGSFYAGAGSVVYVNGSVENIGDSLYNLGHIYVVGDLTNNGTISGNGIYEISKNWENNGLFRRGTSLVILNNTLSPLGPVTQNQLLMGSVSTDFFDLTLVGTGIKSLVLDQTVHHYLDLTDRELAVDNNSMFVVNSDPLAIQRTTGFVSNLNNGWLSRLTTIPGPYLFPMGSSLGLFRYRPVAIAPSVTDTNVYIVGFYNNDASPDGYDVNSKDTTICMVDSLYYHRINRVVGTTPADITIYFDQTTDGPWNGMANWNGAATNMWMNMQPTSQIYSPMWGITRSGWNDFTFDPYALIAKVPDSVGISGPTYVCDNGGPLQYEAWGGDSNDNYIWTVLGGTIVGDSSKNHIWIDWNQPGAGVVTVQEITSFGYCVSLMTHYLVTVNPSPVAGFQVMPEDSVNIFAYDLTSFVDTSINASSWSWDFGDGMYSAQQNPYHMYTAPGKYNICLWVWSPAGCVDSVCSQFEVIEGLIVPNVFTPNNDGYNDYFEIRNSGITQYHLQVYNRWGVMIFESFNPNTLWDGKTLSGVEASEGTYYFLLSAKSDIKDYSEHGTVTLLR
jgi:gliding motility-associated-like protein